jgi:hypothetical protein
MSAGLMRASDLLRTLDRLGEGPRQRRAVTVALSLAGAPALDALLDELLGGETWHKHLGISAAYAVRDAPRLLDRLDDPSLSVRRRAARLAARFAPVELVVAAHQQVDPATATQIGCGPPRS